MFCFLFVLCLWSQIDNIFSVLIFIFVLCFFVSGGIICCILSCNNFWFDISVLFFCCFVLINCWFCVWLFYFMIFLSLIFSFHLAVMIFCCFHLCLREFVLNGIEKNWTALYDCYYYVCSRVATKLYFFDCGNICQNDMCLIVQPSMLDLIRAVISHLIYFNLHVVFFFFLVFLNDYCVWLWYLQMMDAFSICF